MLSAPKSIKNHWLRITCNGINHAIKQRHPFDVELQGMVVKAFIELEEYVVIEEKNNE